MPRERRRLGFSEPFTPEQYDHFRGVLIRIAKIGDGEALFDKNWPEIQRQAQLCQQGHNVSRAQRKWTDSQPVASHHKPRMVALCLL